MDKGIVIETNVGPMRFPTDSNLLEIFRKYGTHDPGVSYFMRKYRHMLFPFFDVGANAGLFSIIASKEAGPNDVIYAFEPDPINLRMMGANLSDRCITNVRIWPVAVSDKDGEIELGTLDCGRSAKSKKETQIFEARSLASVIRETGIVPRFIKVDIEGGEMDAFAGVGDAAPKSVIEFELSWRDQAKRMHELLAARPPGKYRWEILLSDSKIPDVVPLTLAGRKFFLSTAENIEQWHAITDELNIQTEENPRRKWEACITPLT